MFIHLFEGKKKKKDLPFVQTVELIFVIVMYECLWLTIGIVSLLD